jgi:NAD(P)-dependent dehydrogenase (short-subunit alcohol dehydrogenase family)
LGSKDGVDKLCAEVKRRTNKLHVLVNNSGTTWGAQLTDFPEKQGKLSELSLYLAISSTYDR